MLLIFCRQAKLNITERIIEDINQSDGLQNYYTINNQPDHETVNNNSDTMSRMFEKVPKK